MQQQTNFNMAMLEKGLPGKRPQAKRPQAKRPQEKRPRAKRAQAKSPLYVKKASNIITPLPLFNGFFIENFKDFLKDTLHCS